MVLVGNRCALFLPYGGELSLWGVVLEPVSYWQSSRIVNKGLSVRNHYGATLPSQTKPTQRTIIFSMDYQYLEMARVKGVTASGQLTCWMSGCLPGYRRGCQTSPCWVGSGGCPASPSGSPENKTSTVEKEKNHDKCNHENVAISSNNLLNGGGCELWKFYIKLPYKFYPEWASTHPSVVRSNLKSIAHKCEEVTLQGNSHAIQQNINTF